MPLTRSAKEQLVAEYQQGLAAAPHAFILGFKGISVPQVTELRNRVRATGGEYLVVKNNLALRAIDSGALAALKEHFVGPTAVVYSESDPVALAKALTDFAKEAPVIQFKAGLVERRAVEAGQIKEIAQLPGRQQLIAKLLYLLQSPITRLARVLAAVPQSLVVVLDQIGKQKESHGAAAGAAAGEEGQAAVGDAGQAAAGEGDQATAGEAGQAAAGEAGQATAGEGDQATAGEAGQAAVGEAGQPAVGEAGQPENPA